MTPVTKFNSWPFLDALFNNQTFIAEAQAEFEANRTGPLSVASGNAGAWIPLPVVSPSRWRDIAARYESQDPAAYLPAGTDRTVVAGYKAQISANAKAMRSRDSAALNFFLRGSHQEGAIVYLHPASRGTVLVDR